MRRIKHLFTSESVTKGHPDKVSDQISDAILDAMLEQDKTSHVACETLVTTGMVMVAGEITTKAVVDIPSVVRETIRGIGYDDAKKGMDYKTCAILVSLDKQSPDIAQGVNRGKGKEQGAGDQGLMFGYACDETDVLMPLPIHLAHRLVERLAQARESGEIPWLRPDGKSQVTVEYHHDVPVRIHTVVVSAQHEDNVPYRKIVKTIKEKIIKPVIPANMLDRNTVYHVNPTGRFVLGGPHADCGLTGRKIIVDTYGGRGCHGGGAFSGKDPSKVDRSASYMARYIAKNVVAAGLAKRCELQLSYAIGIADPISVLVDTESTAVIPEDVIAELVIKHFPLRPAGIIRYLKLDRPIYKNTAANGHFGRKGPSFTWEKTDKADLLAREGGIPKSQRPRCV